MKILIKNRFSHKTLIKLDGYEFVEVLGEDVVVSPKPLLSKKIVDMGFTIRTTNCCIAGNIITLQDLVSKSVHQLFSMRNFGRKSANEIEEKLSKIGLSLSMNLNKYTETDEEWR